MIKRRNLLCGKQKGKLELGEFILYEPYKNIVRNFVELATKVEKKEFDPVAKVYDGLLSIPNEIKERYEALLGVTSYYQHSQGGRGRYIEKKIASSFETCSLDIMLSELPFWFEYPELHKKKGIFTLNGLSAQEKRIIRTTPWDWIGGKDENTDIGTILKDEKTVVLAELKNRVDSGGTAARREIWTSQKFGIITDYLLKNDKLYKKEGKDFSLSDLLESFGFETLELYMGVLFDKGDRPATLENDKRRGFYSSSKEGFAYLRNKLRTSKRGKILDEDLGDLHITFLLTDSNLELKIEAFYGDDIPLKLFRKKLPVSDLLLLRYDDMWLSQLIAIDERTFLLKYGKNYMTTFMDLLKRDKDLRLKYDSLIESECEETELNKLILYLLKNYPTLFLHTLVPTGRNREEYLADAIQVLCASES